MESKKKLLERIDLAIKANGGDKWRKEMCQCDPDVGFQPCEYCATYNALIATKTFLIEIETVLREGLLRLDKELKEFDKGGK